MLTHYYYTASITLFFLPAPCVTFITLIDIGRKKMSEEYAYTLTAYLHSHLHNDSLCASASNNITVPFITYGHVNPKPGPKCAQHARYFAQLNFTDSKRFSCRTLWMWLRYSLTTYPIPAIYDLCCTGMQWLANHMDYLVQGSQPS